MARISHRDQLLDGALWCIKEKGYARTTARDIAQASNANLASIGYHFGSKEALLDEVLVGAFATWADEIARHTAAAAASSPADLLSTFWHVTLASFRRNKPLLVAFVDSMAQAQHREELRARLDDCYRGIRETVADAVAAAVGMDSESYGVDATDFASLLIAVADGIALQWLLNPKRTPTGERLGAAMAAVIVAAGTKGSELSLRLQRAAE